MITPTTKVTVAVKGEVRERTPRPLNNGKGLPPVAVLGTGGTIASYVDYRTGAVHPALSAGDLLATVPEIADICDVHAEVVFSIFSENMTVENWQELAGVAADRLNSGVEGIIVPHGTDTMGYTAAALSFMLGDIPRPVVVVGAQRSSDRPSSDAYSNLLSAARFITTSDAAEVLVLMHETSSDISAAVHRATKVRKMHTSRRDSFQSIAPRRWQDGLRRGHQYLAPHRKSRTSGRPTAGDGEGRGADTVLPGMSPRCLRAFWRRAGGGHRRLGLGHVSSSSSDRSPRRGRRNGGGHDLPMPPRQREPQRLRHRRDLLSAGVVGGTCCQTAHVKLMWVLGHTNDAEEAGRMMAADLRGELSDRRMML